MTLLDRLITAAVVTLLLVSAVHADTYPSRPVTLIVPFAPGGGLDVLARALSPELETRLEQPFVVENKPGAGSAVGTEQVARAVPDGYTLLVTSDSLVTGAAVNKDLRYDPVTDLVPVSAPYQSSYVLVVHPSLGVSTLKELIAKLKAEPGKYNYASSGIGGSPHLSAAYFIQRTGVDIVHVPLKGSSQMVAELLSGRVQIAFLGLSTTSQYIADGSLKALAVTSPERYPQLPDVPTVAEAGVPDFKIVTWSGVFAPKGTPQPIVERLQKEISAIVQRADFAKRTVANGNTPYGSSSAALGDAVTADLALWRAIVKAGNIQAQ
ncbi:tripartite-type tricarboxylate transporter receptor subunit TctC [Angulomicrobium tetraedrale]|uniref:Tripartite-type tricarboxylate transporter receptor subunit TctC n=1 Tax=Ancylobacter tetraedralis TaxID=217068 RepID=A0A839Z8W6_9HYPH|nr:tripartite tricarboxylate transporter substrate binding protein [Ancylobacter tetraedralis]MBB3770037.1 tripartite-type tricarboxylate transporter receptor subunit TctC [Ancylobacter tetraedralis]